MSKKHITPIQRRHQDYLRIKGLRIGKVYEARLMKARRAEVKRVLDICKSFDDPQYWDKVIDANINESYLESWYEGLYQNAGLPQAKSIVRDLTRAKAASPGGIFERMMSEYARLRSGENIVLVSGTLKDSLRSILTDVTNGHPNLGVDKLAREIFSQYTGNILLWQCRRIAQTETMIALADAGDVAARSLEIPFVKTWCISGKGRTRDSHQLMDGECIDAEDPFQIWNPDTGEFSFMMYPHDTALAAPAGEIINCCCSCIRMPK